MDLRPRRRDHHARRGRPDACRHLCRHLCRHASGDIDPDSGLPWVLEDELPVEGQATLALIDQGGPFPFPDKDGSTFGNFEGLLPDHSRGYYAEYTVLTPGSTDRGARRIITGDGGEFYWTQDHYRSFERIARRNR